MPRKTPQIEIPAEDEATLCRWANSRTLAKQIVDRAMMVLESCAGRAVKDIAQNLGTYPNKVILWRQRYVENGLDGLLDQPRSGRPALYGEAFRDSVLALLGQEPPPKGLSRWDGAALAKELNAPTDAVWKVLRKEGIHLQRHRSWCISTDSHFASKAADIVGLYLSPPVNAVVLCVDEKPSIQAEAQGRVADTKTRPHFQAFMDEVVAEYALKQELHVWITMRLTGRMRAG